jgi:recombinational DNA repair ATPase RecF
VSDLHVPDFRLVNYRCFADTHLKDLGRVNLIVGKNGCGKSALLEGIKIWASRGSRESVVEALAARHHLPETGAGRPFLEWLKRLFAPEE